VQGGEGTKLRRPTVPRTTGGRAAPLRGRAKASLSLGIWYGASRWTCAGGARALLWWFWSASVRTSPPPA